MSLLKIHLIQRIIAFASRDTIELTKLSKVHPIWEETCDDYLLVGNDFKVFPNKYTTKIERHYVPSLIKYTAIATNFPNLIFDGDMYLMIALVAGGFNYFKYNIDDILAILNRFDCDKASVPFLAALMGNVELFDFLAKKKDFVYNFAHNPLYYYEIEDANSFICNLYNKRGVDCTYPNFNIACALIRSGNIDYVKSNYSHKERYLFAYNCYGDHGETVTEYDMAFNIPDKEASRETIWWLYVGDFLSDWNLWSIFLKDRRDPGYENCRSEMFGKSHLITYERDKKINNLRHNNFYDSNFFLEKDNPSNFMYYLNPKNKFEEIEGPFDQWEYDKFKWLIETYPTWKAVRSIITFRKICYFPLIEENFNKLDLSDYTPNQFDKKYRMFIRFRELLENRDS